MRKRKSERERERKPEFMSEMGLERKSRRKRVLRRRKGGKGEDEKKGE